ncbi:MAG: hypothetical protein KF830_07320 [Planctomycetes bacterium]|nr:hypothetical protein [Planctomycetota bacterium]
MLRSAPILLLAAALAGQQTTSEPNANRFVPADACLIARVAAPARWQQQFAKTQVGRLVAAPSVAPWVAKATAAWDAGLAQLRSQGLDADAAEALLRDYTGDLVVSVQVDWQDFAAAAGAGRSPAFAVALALTPAAGFDLAPLAAAIDQAIERADDQRRPLREVGVGDVTLRVTGDDPEPTVSVPQLIDGHLLMIVAGGQPFEAAAARLLAADDRFQGSGARRPLQVEMALGGAMAALLPLVEQGAGMAPFDVGAMLRRLGLAALDRLRLAVDADGAHATADVELLLGDGEPGLFGIACREQTPKLLRLVPPSAEWFSVSAFDGQALFRLVRELWNEFEDVAPLSFEAAMAAFAEATKVQLETDLIAHLGTELLMLEDIDPAADAADEDSLVPAQFVGSCLGLSLQDGKAFGAALERALRSRGLHASRKSEDYAGTRIHRLNLGGLFPIEYTVTDDLLLLVFGDREGARRNLRAVLDAHAASDKAATLPAAVEKHVQSLPAGWSGLSVTPVGQVLDGLGAVVEAMASAQGLDFDEVDEEDEELGAFLALRAVAADIRRLGIDHLVQATYTTKRSLRVHMRW